MSVTFSPLTRRRWANFRSNKRGYWSLCLFLALFTVTLFAELIANDKPLLVRYQDSFYFPLFETYAETEFGGVFEVEADYRERIVQDLIADAGGWMIWPPVRFSYDTIDYDLPGAAPYPPSREHWLGTDTVGKDVLASLIYGVRLSFLFGLVLTFFCSVIGVCVGGLQGYFGGKVDLFGQRFVEIWAGLPTLFILIILASIVESNVFWLLGLLVAFGWMSLVGVVRAEFLRARNFEYIEAARSLGVGDATIMRKTRPSQCDGGDDHVPAVHPDRIDHGAHLARLPGLRVASGLAVVGPLAGPRARQQHPRAVARPHHLPDRRDHADALDLRGRGLSRCVRPAQGSGVGPDAAALLIGGS